MRDLEYFKSTIAHITLNYKTNIYQSIKKDFVEDMRAILTAGGTKRGPKSKVSLEVVFDVIYQLVNTGAQVSYILKQYNISAGTFYRYRNIAINGDIFRSYSENLIGVLPSGGPGLLWRPAPFA